MPDGQIETLKVDAEGQLWVGTTSGGLARYDPRKDRFEIYTPGAGGLSHVGVYALEDSAGGGLWIGTDAGLDRLDPRVGIVRRFDGSHDGPAGEVLASGVTALQRDGGGALWIGTRRGLLRLDPTTSRLTVQRLLAAGEEPAIPRLMLAKDGRLWVGSERRGAFVVEPKTGRVRAVVGRGPTAGLSHTRRVESLLETPDGEIWLGTYAEGLFAVDPATLEARRFRTGGGAPLTLTTTSAPCMSVRG